MFDNLFYLASMAIGFGITLATYRLFAFRNKWPMGALHADLPAIPIMMGLVSIVVGVMFATFRADVGGWFIVALGFLIAILLLWLIRVGSQVTLFLAPLATGLLLVGWLGSEFGYDRAAAIIEHPKELLKRPDAEKPYP